MARNGKIVYRYENNDGIGPYWGGSDWLLDELDYHQRGNTHPGIRQDYPYENGEDDYYKLHADECDLISGCKSIPSINKWFKGHKRHLKEDGFNLYEYQVNHYIVGKSKKQVFFNKHDIICKKKI